MFVKLYILYKYNIYIIIYTHYTYISYLLLTVIHFTRYDFIFLYTVYIFFY